MQAIQSSEFNASAYAVKLKKISNHSFSSNVSLVHSGGFVVNGEFTQAATAARDAFADISFLLYLDGKIIETIAACIKQADDASAMSILSKGC